MCGTFQTSAEVDLSRATLNDLVESFVRIDLGYEGKDIAVSNDLGLLYDAEEDANLDKKLSDLGMSFCSDHI